MNKRIPAITLVETIIYLAIFGVVFGSILQFMITVNEQNYRAEFKTNLGKSVLHMTEHFNDSIDLATDIEIASSTFASDNGVLRLNYSGGTMRYSLNGGRLYFERNAEVFFLTPPRFAIDQFFLEEVHDDDANLIGVRMTMHIYSRDDQTAEETIVTSFFL